MHFVAMLAIQMSLPMTYAPGPTLLSLLTAIGAVGCGLQIIRAKASFPRIVSAGITVGFGVAAMHYIGMASMRFAGSVAYTPGLWGLSVLVGIAAATAALWMSITLQEKWRRGGAALVMGGAICGMHYVGMASTVFRVDPLAQVVPGLPSGPIAITVTLTALALILCALVFVAADRRILASAQHEAEVLRRSNDQLAVANAELELGRQQFDAALSNMSQGLTLFDSDQKLIVCNRRYGEIYGLSQDQTRPGTTLADIINHRMARGSLPDMSRAEFLARREKMSLSAGSSDITDKLSDGRMISMRHQPLPNGGWVTTHEDITATVAAAAELHEAKDRAEQAEALLRDAVDSMSEGFVIYDHEDRFVMCNETYRQNYRKLYPEGADFLVRGAHLEEILRQVLALGGDAKARGREEEWVAERLAHHRQASGAIEQRLGDGSWFLVTNRRMKNGGITGLRIDITALKHAEAALLESEAGLELAQATAGIGSWELDVTTGRYIGSKELYRICGFAADFEPTVDNVAAYVHPEDYPPVRPWIGDLMAGRGANTRETRFVRPDGGVRLLRVEGRALIDPDGTIRRLAGTMQDITDRRLIEQQLAQAQKMEAIGNLTGGMAHDFNNGLGVIIGNLDLLGRLIKTDPITTELCNEARDAALRCTELIRLLLAFARRQPLLARQIDVNALVERTAKLLGRTLGEDITLTSHRDLALWPVVADPAQLEAALTNLANNARDAMPRGGRLDITTKTAELDAHYAALHPEAIPGAYVLIEVSDTGIGIAPDIISRIFEPFFTTKEPGQGTGLGLSMVFGFVKQSGGHLAVYSEPGLGSTFRIYLPRANVSDTRADMPADRQPVAGGQETVLLVEDNAPLRRTTARQLAELGYQVREADHADAALALLSSGDRVDLLFTDVVMPGTMDGFDLAQHATRLRRGLKVLITSGFPGVRGAGQRIADCPFPLLNKPYPHDDLARAVRAVLDRDDNHVMATAECPLAGSDQGRPGSELAIITEKV
jgi:PAS domain S-box-containing protein